LAEKMDKDLEEHFRSVVFCYIFINSSEPFISVAAISFSHSIYSYPNSHRENCENTDPDAERGKPIWGENKREYSVLVWKMCKIG
jgi:hypothetical protein